MLETNLTDHKKRNHSIRTEGIKYSGSKLKLLPHILSIVKTLPIRSIFDGFSGTTRVSQFFAKNGYTLTSNDCSIWSKVFSECYLKGRKTDLLQEKIEYLNQLKGKKGWFTEHYGGTSHQGFSMDSSGKKKVWQIHNTKKLDSIRLEIDKISETPIEKSILLTSLILALDKVDNTLGHYASYLKKWSPRSFQTMKLKTPLMESYSKDHKVLHQDIFEALFTTQSDLSYFDPPYGSNNEKMPPSRVRYASYYHIWKTICLNDQPDLVGRAGRRVDCSDQKSSSVFEEFRKNKDGDFIALKALEKLIKECRSPYILLSYSNGGRATKKDICQIIREQSRKSHIFSIDYKKNVMAGMRWTHDWIKKDENKNREFLFLIEK